ncbi:hypothetical protein [Bacillus pacificus]|uniref:hypothetical protein n=1 Tax=Bacillus pacificus TaxID=2026187 RepID=UPI00178C404A|nr:hypothetical protein [Bacillus pacificus]
MNDIEWLHTKYFCMLTVYKIVKTRNDTKRISKVLLALEDFERTYFQQYGFGEFCDLLATAEQKGLIY